MILTHLPSGVKKKTNEKDITSIQKLRELWEFDFVDTRISFHSKKRFMWRNLRTEKIISESLK